MEVRRLLPPKLSPSHLTNRILCYRPMRLGSPKVSVVEEHLNGCDKVIVHNYGHGGSGLSLAPGSSKFAMDELKSRHPELIDENEVAIVGGGVNGLFSAYWLLKEPDYKGRVKIVAERLTGLASHQAGGVVAPASMANAPEAQMLVDRFFVASYEFYRRIAEGSHEDFPREHGAALLPVYFLHRDHSELERFVLAGVLAPAKDVLVDFGNGCQREMVVYDEGLMVSACGEESKGIVQALTHYLKGSGRVVFEERKVESFNEISTRFIFNCSGLGARQLSADEKMVPVQGHLIALAEQDPGTRRYLIVGEPSVEKTASGMEMKAQFYQFPKYFAETGEVGLLGGTFIPQCDASTPNEEQFDKMVRRAKEFYGVEQ